MHFAKGLGRAMGDLDLRAYLADPQILNPNSNYPGHPKAYIRIEKGKRRAEAANQTA
jgi:hypothetical protein